LEINEITIPLQSWNKQRLWKGRNN
jgi:hypothetical protein